jgi:hypothetical protein
MWKLVPPPMPRHIITPASLHNKIQSLRASIEAKQAEMQREEEELRAYERVLALETGTAGPRPSSGSRGDGASARAGTEQNGSAGTGTDPAFDGKSKTAFVFEIIRSRGAAGATPKEVQEVFTRQGLETGKNTIYTALSSFVKQRKLKNKNGRYVAIAGKASPKPVPSTAGKNSIGGIQNLRSGASKKSSKQKALGRSRTKTGSTKAVPAIAKKTPGQKAPVQAAVAKKAATKKALAKKA